jgi:succinoglycan biosynthesis transport protein ExoP
VQLGARRACRPWSWLRPLAVVNRTAAVYCVKDQGRSVEVRRLFALARRWIRLLVLCIVVGTIVGYALASVLPKSYSSTTTLLVGQPFSSTTDTLAVNQLQAQTYAELATLRPTLQKVIAAVGLTETPEDLAGQVLVRASLTSNLLTVVVSNPKSDIAAAIANAVAAQLIALAPAPTKGLGPPNLTVVEAAVPAAAPSSPKVALITALGTAGGLLVAAGVIAIAMGGDRGVRRLESGSEADK